VNFFNVDLTKGYERFKVAVLLQRTTARFFERKNSFRDLTLKDQEAGKTLLDLDYTFEIKEKF